MLYLFLITKFMKKKKKYQQVNLIKKRQNQLLQ